MVLSLAEDANHQLGLSFPNPIRQFVSILHQNFELELAFTSERVENPTVIFLSQLTSLISILLSKELD